jgi:hypothetical protein
MIALMLANPGEVGLSCVSGRFLRLFLCALVAIASVADAAQPGGPTSGPATRLVRRRVVVVPSTQRAGHSIPGMSAQEQMRAKIREIYAVDYADRSISARRLLADRLIEASRDTQRDTDAKFVLLSEARDVAAAAGDVTTAFEAVDALVAAFPLVKLHERGEVMRIAIPALGTPQANLAATSICMDLVDQCVVEADYDRADVLLALAESTARQAKSVPHFRWIEARGASIRPLQAAWEVAKSAESTLARTPSDPQANVVMGKFVAFVKGDFDAGLTMLEKGSDPALSSLAKADLDNPETPAAQLELAEAWWDLADAQPAEFRQAIRNRAGFWYRKAAVGLDGLDRALARRRLQELNPPPKPGARRDRPPDALLLNTHYYRASIAEVTWETAQRLCQEAGGQLVCVETRAEGELMTRLARGRLLWLGAGADDSGKWSWLSGAEFLYTNWAASEPASSSPESHLFIGPSGVWRTSTGKAGFICEWSQ